MSSSETKSDSTQRFIFDETDVRGELVQFSQGFSEILASHDYPQPVQALLGQLLVASVLLSTSIKFDGKLILQIKSAGQIALLMAECTCEQAVRGIAKHESGPLSDDFKTLLCDGTLSITIDPDKGERYQGIVPLDGDTLADCLGHYFAQSEQLATHFHFSVLEQQLAGIMLQQLPATKPSDVDARQEDWNRVHLLAQSITDQEMVSLTKEEILFRLFHDEKTRLFDEKPVVFRCSCSPQRFKTSLISLGQDELNAILKDNEDIHIQCEFCLSDYNFAPSDVAAWF